MVAIIYWHARMILGRRETWRKYIPSIRQLNSFLTTPSNCQAKVGVLNVGWNSLVFQKNISLTLIA